MDAHPASNTTPTRRLNGARPTLDERPKPFAVYNARFERVGAYAESGEAKRALKNNGPGAHVVQDGAVVLAIHHATTPKQKGAIDARVRAGAYREAAPATPPPAARDAAAAPTRVTVKAERVEVDLEVDDDGDGDVPRCARGCDAPRGSIQANTRPALAPYCQPCRNVVYQAEHAARKQERPVPTLAEVFATHEAARAAPSRCAAGCDAPRGVVLTGRTRPELAPYCQPCRQRYYQAESDAKRVPGRAAPSVAEVLGAKGEAPTPPAPPPRDVARADDVPPARVPSAPPRAPEPAPDAPPPAAAAPVAAPRAPATTTTTTPTTRDLFAPLREVLDLVDRLGGPDGLARVVRLVENLGGVPALEEALLRAGEDALARADRATIAEELAGLARNFEDLARRLRGEPDTTP